MARGALNAAQKRGDAAIKRLVLENAALRDELRQCSGDAAGERRDRAVNQLTSSDSSSSDADLPAKPNPGADDAHAQRQLRRRDVPAWHKRAPVGAKRASHSRSPIPTSLLRWAAI